MVFPLGVIGGIVSGVTGTALLYDYVRRRGIRQRAKQVEATITDVEVRKHVGRGRSYWTPNVSFTYTYADSTYTSSQLYPQTETPVPNGGKYWEETAQKIAGRLQEGEKTTVYVDPTKPDNAFLIRKTSPQDRAELISGTFLWVAGVVLAVVSIGV